MLPPPSRRATTAWVQGNVVVVRVFVKKPKKTPLKEIQIALQRAKEIGTNEAHDG